MAWAISKPCDAWLHQAREAWAALEPQAPHGSALRDLAAIDQHTFALLIEALAALTPGQVSQELQDLAGLRPVGEVLDMPDLGDTERDADAGDIRNWQEGHPMDTVDITPTPEACRQIARLFRARQADAEALAARAAQALDALDTTDDAALAPWGRDLLTVAFAALYKAEGARVSKMWEGLEALGPYADNGKGSDDAP